MPRIDRGARGDIRQRRAIQGLRPWLVVTPVKTAAYSARYGELVRCNPTGGAFTVTLPPAAGHRDDAVCVKNQSASATAITIARTGSDTIDGATGGSIAAGRGTVLLVSDGVSDWMIVSS